MFDEARLEVFVNNQLLGQCEGQFLLEQSGYLQIVMARFTSEQ